MDLPETRRAGSHRSIPETCHGSIVNLVLFTAGSVEEQRAANWRRLFLGQEEPSAVDLNIAVSDLPAETVQRIDKDVHRTDRGVAFYYPDIGDLQSDLERPHLASLRRILVAYAFKHAEVDYVQGMNDIAAPILSVMGGAEVETYRIFERIMQQQHLYFTQDGEHTKRQLAILFGMLQVADPLLHDRLGLSAYHGQLFIAYRWLLLLFKREVGFEHFPLVLETIYAAPTSSYELFVALALMLLYRHEIMEIGHHFDKLLQFYSQLAGRHDVGRLLVLADQLHQYFCSNPIIRNDPRFTDIIR